MTCIVNSRDSLTWHLLFSTHTHRECSVLMVYVFVDRLSSAPILSPISAVLWHWTEKEDPIVCNWGYTGDLCMFSLAYQIHKHGSLLW